MSTARVRRSPEEARGLILEAAEELLAAGGPAAVEVRAVAARVGMTDAGVNHHFGGRDQLLVALLRHGGRRLRAEVDGLIGASLEADGVRLGPLVEALAALYADGYGRLAIGLHAAGWRDEGSGLLQPLVDAVHAARVERAAAAGRPTPERRETQLALAALHQALATEPVYGEAFRRSVGLTAAADDPGPQIRSWTAMLSTSLDLPA
jgi:AcrR family transcriptional regulator